MQLVVVDMSAHATADQATWVVRACSEALSHGRCVLAATADEGQPEAVAIVRVKDVEGRLVRIEVGRRRDERAAWSVRELDFAAGDPPAERWRSVGLALATLVGEIEQARQDTEAASQLSAEAKSELPLETGSDLPLASSEGDVADTGGAELEAPSQPLQRPSAFIGFGALAGQGTGAGALRWGGGGRFAWLFENNVQLALGGDYSAMGAEPGIDLDWVRLAARAGYRHFVSDAWSLALSLGIGARGLGIAATDAAGARSSREWSALAAASMDAWWQLADFGGVWFELEVSSIGRRTRLIARDGRVESELPAGDVTAGLGLWFAP